MGRHSKEIDPAAEGAPLGQFLRMLQTASGKTWRELGSAGHMSHTNFSQGADGHLARRWDTVETWLRTFYRAADVDHVAGWSLDGALAHAHRIWLRCHECVRLGIRPADRGGDPVPGAPAAGLGGTIVMDVHSPGAAIKPPTEAATRRVISQFGGANLRRDSRPGLHEARSAAEFAAAIEQARATAGVAWADLMTALLQGVPARDRAAALGAWPQAAG